MAGNHSNKNVRDELSALLMTARKRRVVVVPETRARDIVGETIITAVI
jgi:hypothetical protein